MIGNPTSRKRERRVFSRSGWGFAVLFTIIAALAIPVFAHGCHAGDHDLEPSVVPVQQKSKVRE